MKHREAIPYSLLAIVAIGAVFVVCYSSPVAYVRLIAEDQWGEYASAVAFGLAGLALLAVAKGSGALSARILWGLAGIVLLLIAAEEISWGQRIVKRLFGLTIAPAAVTKINTQGEFNFHNIGAFDVLNRSWLHYVVGALVLAWASFSAWLAWIRPGLWEQLEGAGIPVIKSYLVPLFLAMSYLFLARPLPNSAELGESFLALATLTWAIDLLMRRRTVGSTFSRNRLLCVFGVYVVVLFVTAALVVIVPGGLSLRMNLLATNSYPAHGMSEQAEELFLYIRENPQFERSSTRLNHAQLLFELGRASEGKEILKEAIPLQRVSAQSSDSENVDVLRRRGMMYSLLGETDLARRDFDEALKIDAVRFDASGDPEEQAQILWSRSKTLAEAGEYAAARHAAEEAKDKAVSAKLAAALTRWIADLD